MTIIFLAWDTYRVLSDFVACIDFLFFMLPTLSASDFYNRYYIAKSIS